MLHIGVVGLGVMGENLILNMSDKGYKVGVYNRTKQKTDKFVAENGGTREIVGYGTLQDLVQSLCKPRKVLLMITAGSAVDACLDTLSTLLDKDDIVIDGGNSDFADTERRCRERKGQFLYVGCGISGGKLGARHGASIMPGGDEAACKDILPVLQSIAALSHDKTPCCEWIGPAGSGHLVKTVHNGIEYAEMQTIADFYQIMRGYSTAQEIAGMFRQWTEYGTAGYLIDAVQSILMKTDEDGRCVIDNIIDAAEQKGTGTWTVQHALQYNVAVPSIECAVSARNISNMKAFRTKTAEIVQKGVESASTDTHMPDVSVDDMRKAFVLCRALSYTQGYNLIHKIAEVKGWNISLDALCRVWSNGCIIRSEFLPVLQRMCAKMPLEHSAEFVDIAAHGIAPLRQIVSYCVSRGVYAPCLLSSLSYYDAITTATASGNMIQAMRDYFGAHTLVLSDTQERVHIEWE